MRFLRCVMPFRFRAILPCFETCKVPVRELKVLAKRAMRAELISQIEAWNERYPIATDVRTQMYPDRVYKTRTKALVLFDRRAAIYLQGLNGYFVFFVVCLAVGVLLLVVF